MIPDPFILFHLSDLYQSLFPSTIQSIVSDYFLNSLAIA